TPSEYLEIEIAADGKLADYDQISNYFAALDEASERVEVVSLGKTTLGREMIMAVVSSSNNIAALDSIRATAAKLADPRGVPPDELERLIADGKTVVLVTCNIHATEIASSQMAMIWSHQLASAPSGSNLAAWLDDVILLLVPSLNPDGQQMVVDWYRKHRGTEFEGGRMPWLYHHYVGHDNNRDWFMLTQKETRALSRAIYHEWFPQIFVDHHQMGATGPRMFIPPFADPLDPDIHPLIWREIELIGSAMAMRLEQADKPGVISGYVFDAYWMGGTRNTGWWKNVTGLLTEVASARIATPVFVHPTELKGDRKGLVEYQPQVNFPNPWQGGWWRLSDIIAYQQISSNALLEVASRYREDFLANIAERASSAVALGEGRLGYRIPRAQRDWPTALRLGRLLADHGVEVGQARNGDLWISLSQPYSRFVVEVLEKQEYPEIRRKGSEEILAPYDISTWSLPLLMNVEVEKRKMPFDLETAPLGAPIIGKATTRDRALAKAPHYAIERTSPEGVKLVNAALAAGHEVRVGLEAENDLVQAPVPVELGEGTFYLPGGARDDIIDLAGETDVAVLPVASLPSESSTIRRPRVGLYKPYAYPSMDEGWTRFVLEQYGFEVTTIEPGAIRAGKDSKGGLSRAFDAIILPDIDLHLIEKGQRETEEGEMAYERLYPDPYGGGIGEEGVEALKAFVEAGGTLVSMADATDFVIDKFNVPVVNPLAKKESAELAAPGAILKANVDRGHPITWGLPESLPIFHDDRRALETTIPGAEIDRTVLLWYPKDEDEILLSGWIRGKEHLAGRVAAVALQEFGGGRIVLFGFSPQHRAQTHGTFPLLFNALFWSVM
ncbi:MAG: M14 family metallopeptidase, partial [Thermoanaerobaculia bacterium]|nr:M14 family metallopeptidase [Thermoanaerobaculia bacterium]